MACTKRFDMIDSQFVAGMLTEDFAYIPSVKYDCKLYKCVTTAYLNPDVEYGELLDERDNQVYRTVKIGEQEWMAQNLNFLTIPSADLAVKTPFSR